MRIRLAVSIVAVLLAITVPVKAYSISLELVGESELSVDQGFGNSPENWYPIQGEPLIAWGRFTNNGDGLVQLQAGGFNGMSGFYSETPIELWTHPDLDASDPFVWNNSGDFPGLELEPGESIEVPIMRIWGFSFTNGNAPLWELPIGTTGNKDGGTFFFWDGFDVSPNNALDGPPTVFVEFDGAFSVTVVPEPSAVFLLLGFASIAMIGPRHSK